MASRAAGRREMGDFGHINVITALEFLSQTCYMMRRAPDSSRFVRRVVTQIRQDRRQTDRWVSLDRA
jgi:hypothetical protein